MRQVRCAGHRCIWCVKDYPARSPGGLLEKLLCSHPTFFGPDNSCSVSGSTVSVDLYWELVPAELVCGLISADPDIRGTSRDPFGVLQPPFVGFVEDVRGSSAARVATRLSLQRGGQEMCRTLKDAFHSRNSRSHVKFKFPLLRQLMTTPILEVTHPGAP